MDASISQVEGNNNDAKQVVSGLTLELVIHQKGSGNYALQDIKHANGFEPTVTYTTDQHGNNNDAWMTAWGDTEDLLISQIGNLNDAVMTVGVNGASASISQNGNGNYAVAEIL